MNDEKCQQHLLELMKFYSKYDDTFIKNNLSVQIRVVSNIYGSILECELTDKEKENFEIQKDIVKEYSGYILYPSGNRKDFIIFIADKQFGKDLLYILTLFHELTHLIDFYNFANEYCNGDYSIMEKIKEFPMFYYWTEYHAKKVSYKLYRKYLNDELGIDMNNQDIIFHMKTNELKYQNHNLFEQLNNNSSNFTQQMYFSMHYLARYSVWEEIDPEYFKDGKQFPYWLDITFKGKAEQLYKLMKKMADFNLAKNNFSKLEKILIFLAKE